MAVFECVRFDDAALHFCPSMTVGCIYAWIKAWQSIRALAMNLPGVYKLYNIRNLQLALSGEVVFAIPIVVSTQPTNLSLKADVYIQDIISCDWNHLY